MIAMAARYILVAVGVAIFSGLAIGARCPDTLI
jgi:hypothetical protein